MSISASFEVLASGCGLVEGPRVDDSDRVYWSDVRKGGVYRRAPDGVIETVVPKRRGVGGIALHADGGIVVSGRNLCHVRDGVSRIVFEDTNVPSFNDIFTDAKGRILAGTQCYDPFDAEAVPIPGDLHRIGAQGQSEILYGDLELTNGIGFSPDGSLLYHADTTRNQVLVHDVVDGERVANRRVLAELPRGNPDGLAVDEDGCVWVAAYGGGCVVCVTPQGGVDRLLEVPAVGVASVCFGGADRRDLYVATGDHRDDPSLGGCLLRTRVAVPGLAVPKAIV